MDDLFEQKNLIMESAALGASIALNRLGLIKDEISQREAFRVYGESLVRTWLNRGWITRIKTGCREYESNLFPNRTRHRKATLQQRKIALITWQAET